jgi:hypothetical protein
MGKIAEKITISDDVLQEMKNLIATYSIQKYANMPEEPYLRTLVLVEHQEYNPKFGDDKECECGHSYYRHFDSYEKMEPIGCKYCHCFHFKEPGPPEPKDDFTIDFEKIFGEKQIKNKK